MKSTEDKTPIKNNSPLVLLLICNFGWLFSVQGGI